MQNNGSDPDRELFFADVIALLREVSPEAEWPDPAPDAHLWAEGYLDSVGLLEIVYHLEERLNRDIELTGDFLPNFFTLNAIYRAYVAPARSAASGG